ncbi:MAG: ankyrin repeat domain-containing protein [Anaerolineae bacterium]|nr:ankyrin repeat domain-containing protein [Ardenticatenia bacterium]
MTSPTATHPTNLDPETVRAFVIAGHGNLETVQAMLAETPALRDAAHEWRPGDTETALAGAAHVGNAPIAEYLLTEGAPLTIHAAAMLGRRDDVAALLDASPELLQAPGAHGIPLLAHAALSGSAELVADLHGRGAREGVAMALGMAAGRGDAATVRWLLDNDQPDLAWTNVRGQTALEVARAAGHDAVVAALEECS